jgi:hypothetical protein
MRFTAFLSKNPVWVDDRLGMSIPRATRLLYVQHHGKYIFEIIELYSGWLKSSHSEPTFGR